MNKSRSVSEIAGKFARNSDWNLFKTFYEIGKTGGIGAAARSLNKQQPSVSAALKRFEEEVGAQLCTRTRKGVELTILGQQLFSICEGLYLSIRNIPRASSAIAGDFTGQVTLSTISNLNLLELDRALQAFHLRYPRIEIRLDVTTWRQVIQSLKNGDVELAIGFEDRPDSEMNYLPLRRETQQLYCGRKHALFGRPPAPPSNFHDHDFILALEEPDEMTRYRNRHDLGRRVSGTADRLPERMWLIQLGVGIGFLPKVIVESVAAAQEFWPLLPEALAPKCMVYLMSHARNVRSAPAQLLLDTVETFISAQRRGKKTRALTPAHDHAPRGADQTSLRHHAGH